MSKQTIAAILLPICSVAAVLAGNTRLPDVEPIESPAGAGSAQPNLTSGPDSTVYLSWLQPKESGGTELRYSVLRGNAWSASRSVASGDNWFVNWADFPSMAALSDGSLIAHWLAKSGPSTYAYDVNLSRSNDGGASWSDPIVPHRDGTQTEHGFVSLLPREDGRVGAIWLDGREMSGQHGSPAGSMTLRYATLGPAGTIGSEALLDKRVCECCQTSAAGTAGGAIVVYRNRSESEVRDIGVVLLRDGKWSEPRIVAEDGWEIKGCPVNGPSVSALGDRVVVAWFTMAKGRPRVKAAFSRDGGLSFGEPIRIDEGPSVGRAEALLLEDGSALVGRLEHVGGEFQIMVKRVKPDGEVLFDVAAAASSGARSSGFPQFARNGEEVVVAWTDNSKPSRPSTT